MLLYIWVYMYIIMSMDKRVNVSFYVCVCVFRYVNVLVFELCMWFCASTFSLLKCMGSSIDSRFEKSRALRCPLGLELSEVWILEGCVIDQRSRLNPLEDWRRGEPMLQGWVLEPLSSNYYLSIGRLRCENARSLRSSSLNAWMPYRLIELKRSHTSSWAQ